MPTKHLTDEQVAQNHDAAVELAKFDDATLIEQAKDSEGGRLAQQHIDAKRYGDTEFMEFELYRDLGLIKQPMSLWNEAFQLKPDDSAYYTVWWRHQFGKPLRKDERLFFDNGQLYDEEELAEFPGYLEWKKAYDRRQAAKWEAMRPQRERWEAERQAEREAFSKKLLMERAQERVEFLEFVRHNEGRPFPPEFQPTHRSKQRVSYRTNWEANMGNIPFPVPENETNEARLARLGPNPAPPEPFRRSLAAGGRWDQWRQRPIPPELLEAKALT